MVNALEMDSLSKDTIGDKMNMIIMYCFIYCHCFTLITCYMIIGILTLLFENAFDGIVQVPRMVARGAS